MTNSSSRVTDRRFKKILQKHGRWISLFGLFVVVTSYVVKEGFRDRLKELANSIENANQSFSVHDEFRGVESRLGNMRHEIDSLLYKNSKGHVVAGKVPSSDRKSSVDPLEPDERVSTIYTTIGVVGSSLQSAAVLMDEIPPDVSIKRDFEHVEGQFTSLRDKCFKGLGDHSYIFNPTRSNEKAHDNLIEDCYSNSFPIEEDADRFQVRLVTYAVSVHRTLKNRVDNLTIACYVIYGLGWIITFLGRAYDVKDIEAIP